MPRRALAKRFFLDWSRRYPDGRGKFLRGTSLIADAGQDSTRFLVSGLFEGSKLRPIFELAHQIGELQEMRKLTILWIEPLSREKLPSLLRWFMRLPRSSAIPAFHSVAAKYSRLYDMCNAAFELCRASFSMMR